MKRSLLVVSLIILFVTGNAAADSGVLINGEFDVQGADRTEPIGNIVFAPWVSVPFNSSELYVSAGLNTSIHDEKYAAPELFRLEYANRSSPSISF